MIVSALASGEPLGTLTPGVDAAASLSTDTRAAVIFYTTDGSAPAPGRSGTAIYRPGSPIAIAGHNTSMFVRAIAIGPNMYPSLELSETVIVRYEMAADPVFSISGGIYNTTLTVALSSPSSTAEIYYTITDGYGPAPTPMPGQVGTILYAAPITIDRIRTIRAKSIQVGKMDSTEVEHTYVLKVATPVATPPPLYHATPPDVSISSSTPGSQVAVTLDTGSDPVPQGTDPAIYTFNWVSWQAESRAIGHKSGWANSDVAVFEYNAPGNNEYDFYDRAAILDWEPSFSMNDIIKDSSLLGAVVLFRTTEGRFGKMVIHTVDFDGSGGIRFRFTTYAPDGSVHATDDNGEMSGNFTFDFDTGVEGSGAGQITWDAWNRLGATAPDLTRRRFAKRRTHDSIGNRSHTVA